MIPHKCHPALVRAPAIRPVVSPRRPVLANRARRHADPQFEQQLVGDSLLTPCQVFPSHPANQGLEFGRQRRSPGPGLELPEEPKALPMPADQRRRFDDDERVVD